VHHNQAISKDYYNANLRSRYGAQLMEIKNFLQKSDILVEPKESIKTAMDYRKAKFASWQNLKAHLEHTFVPGQYQVCVDISAMYMDHLIDSIHKITQTMTDIKRHIEQSPGTRINEIVLSGVKAYWWDRIRGHLKNGTDARASYRESVLRHLTAIISRLDNPELFLAAYNFGIRKVLKHSETGLKLPCAIEQYAKKVSLYQRIMGDMAHYGFHS